MDNKNIILTIIFSLSCFLALAVKHDYRKLLVYNVIEDSITIHISDSNWVNKEICLKVKIDTIDYRLIKKNDKFSFLYMGQVYYYEQIFPLENYQDLRKGKLLNFSVEGLDGNYTPDHIVSEGYCVNECQKNFIKQLFRNGFKRKVSRNISINRGTFLIQNKHITLNDIFLRVFIR